MNIIAITAHPDDVEFQCAGTLILLKQLGHKIAITTVNNGSCGSAEKGPEEIAAIRGKEARKAAALIGAEYFCAEVNDLESVFNNEIRRRVCEIVRIFSPDIIITHYPDDYMSDHEIACRLARDATFTATLRNYSTGVKSPAPKLDHIPYLYYCLPLEGRDHFGGKVTPEFVLNIAGVIDKKAEMLCCHASQREWLRRQHGMDEYIDFMKRESNRVGAICGFEYGEGFIQHLGHAYPRKNILAELLPAKQTGSKKNMTATTPIEIICPACGNESLLKRTPRYEGFKRAGEDLSCASCGHKFANETEVPFKAKKQSALFDRGELNARPMVFKPGDAARLCRRCEHYIVNPFIQRCALHKKEVEATDSCAKFQPRPPPKETPKPAPAADAKKTI